MCPRVPLEVHFDLPARTSSPFPPLFEVADSQGEGVIEEPHHHRPPREPSPPPPAFEVSDSYEDGCLVWIPEIVLRLDTTDLGVPELQPHLPPAGAVYRA